MGFCKLKHENQIGKMLRLDMFSVDNVVDYALDLCYAF
jgi:hypothetical protein